MARTEFLGKAIGLAKEYCEKEGLSFEKLEKCVKSFNDNVVFFQSMEDLTDGAWETPIDVVLIARKEAGTVRFEMTEKTRQLLSTSI